MPAPGSLALGSMMSKTGPARHASPGRTMSKSTLMMEPSVENEPAQLGRISDQDRSFETRRGTELQVGDRMICQRELHGFFLSFGR